MKMRLFVDMDGVVANFNKSARQRLRDKGYYGQCLHEDPRKYQWFKDLGMNTVENFMSALQPLDTLFAQLDPLPYWEELRAEFNDNFRLLTRSTSKFYDEIHAGKSKWCLEQCFPLDQFMHVSTWKGDVIKPAQNSILVDDNPKEIEKWLHHGGLGILVHQSWHQDEMEMIQDMVNEGVVFTCSTPERLVGLIRRLQVSIEGSPDKKPDTTHLHQTPVPENATRESIKSPFLCAMEDAAVKQDLQGVTTFFQPWENEEDPIKEATAPTATNWPDLVPKATDKITTSEEVTVQYDPNLVQDFIELFRPFDGKRISIKETSDGGVDMQVLEEPPESICQEAHRLVCGDRQNQYGPPDQDFRRSANMWTEVLSDKLIPGQKITPQEVAMMMVCMKISRQKHQKKRDNWTDIAGYAQCGYMCDQAASETTEFINNKGDDNA